MKEIDNTVELQEAYAVLQLPRDVVEATINVSLMLGDNSVEITNVHRTMDRSEVWNAFEEGETVILEEDDDPEPTSEEPFFVVSLPERSLEVTISCKLIQSGQLVTVDRVFGAGDLRVAFKLAERGYIPPDAVFSITDEGRRYLDEMNKNR